MAKNKLKESLYTIFFMFSITFVFIFVLSFINFKTKEQIKINEKLALRKAVLYAANVNISDPMKIEKYFTEKIEEKEGYFILNENSQKTYVFLTSGAGLWGEIDAVVGLKSNLKTLTGIDFIKQSETPGLGARISENWFKEQFRNMTGPFNTLIGEKEKPEKNEFSAITGATISSSAVKDIINKSLKEAKTIIK